MNDVGMGNKDPFRLASRAGSGNNIGQVGRRNAGSERDRAGLSNERPVSIQANKLLRKMRELRLERPLSQEYSRLSFLQKYREPFFWRGRIQRQISPTCFKNA